MARNWCLTEIPWFTRRRACTIRITVTDVVSPSYFIVIAAVELGFFAREGIDVEFVLPPSDASRALREGEIDLYGASPYVGLMAFPDWQGGKLLCALSQGAYWVLAVRADLGAVRGDFSVLRGLRLLSGRGPSLALARLLKAIGMDLKRDGVQIVAPPWPPDPGANLARQGARAISEDVADGFWGNALRAEYAVRNKLATVLADIRHGDGPSESRHFTFPALVASDQFVQQHQGAAAASVRAIVKTQRALKADPSLASHAAKRLFPREEAMMIAELVGRDAAFYDATISKEAVFGAIRFAHDVGLITRSINYEDVVVETFRPLWRM